MPIPSSPLIQMPSTPPRFRCILGTTPGLLDPTQPARVLRGLGWRLSFVVLEDMKDPTCAEADGMRRVVIDEPPMGAGAPQCRLVPNAELGPRVTNEGKSWPRIVDICGELIVCAREQWYIYKLDPAYQCYVPLHPYPPIIRPKGQDPRNDQGKREVPDTGGELERLSKRFRTTLSMDDTGPTKVSQPSGPESGPQVDIDPDITMRGSTPSDTIDPDTTTSANALHASHADTFPSTVEPTGTTPELHDGINVPEVPPPHQGDTDRSGEEPEPQASAHQGDTDRSNEGREPADAHHAEPDRSDEGPERQASAHHAEQFTADLLDGQPLEDVDVEMEVEDHNYPQDEGAKRKDRGPDYETGEQPIGENLEREHSPKRRRTTDPTNPTTPSKEWAREAKRKAMRRSERISNKKLREEVVQEDRRRREDNFWREMLKSEDPEPARSQVPPPIDSSSSGSSSSGSSSSGLSGSSCSSAPETREDDERWASILESRRKIADLEKDKPLWAEQQRKREEEEMRKAKEAAAAAAEKEKERHAAEEKRRAAERDRQHAEHADKRKSAVRRARHLERGGQEERKRLEQRYSWRSWTIDAALRHYVEAAKVFDDARFSPENPALFATVPWPTLVQPWLVKEEDITWEAVEEFFHKAHGKMLESKYRKLVDETHKRFHPDRLRARKMANSLEHQELGDKLSRYTNLVSQAVTPIWRGCKGT